MTIVFELIAIAVLIFLNGLLAMSEMAVVSSKKARLQKLMDEGHTGALTALQLTEGDNNDFLASIQIGITLIGVLAGAFSGATLSDKISATIVAYYPILASYADAIGLGMVVIGVTYFSLVLGELVPKRLALNNPEVIATRVSKSIYVIGKTLRPFVYFLSMSTKFVLRVFRADSSSDQTVTEEEVKLLIEEGRQAGVFEKHEESMMKRVLKLNDFKVSELMTPRIRVIDIDLNEPVEETLAKITKYKHSYFPAFDKTIDRPVGVLSIKKILTKLIQGEQLEMRSCLSEPLFVPESMTVDIALNRFKHEGKQIAFVVDEYGGFAGLITIYDITESIVGSIPNNNAHAEKKIVVRANGSLLVDGQTSIEALNEFIDLSDLEDGDFQTVAGLIMSQLGKIPTEGEWITIGPYKIEVVDMDRQRIDKVLIEKS